jgi:hypothetical protein
MNDVKGFFDSFKEFIWDIIGYLLPGTFLLIVLSVVINEKYFFDSKLATGTNNLFAFIFIVLSYLLGYVIYGVSLVKEDIFKNDSYKQKIEAEISCNLAFTMCKQVYIKKENERNLQVDANISVRQLRTQVMSYIPEQDQKIYTFTFRSELANHTANILFLLGILGLLFWGLQAIFPFSLFKTDLKFIILYFIFIIAFFSLRKTRDRFYDISMRVPFSMYMAKVKK